MKKRPQRRPRVFDEAFKRMAVELSHAKGSLQEAARELGIDASRITKWRQCHKSPSQFANAATGLSEEQKLIRRLQKELKDAQLDRTAEAARYTKKGSRHAVPGIFSTVRRAVERMGKALNVSSSGYYYWRKHPVGVRQLKQAQLLNDIRQVHAQSESRYGSPAPRWLGSLMNCGSGA